MHCSSARVGHGHWPASRSCSRTQRRSPPRAAILAAIALMAAHCRGAARRQHGDTIRGLLERKCDDINADIAALGQLHWQTAGPRSPLPFTPAPSDALPPVPPAPVVPGFAERQLSGRRQAAEAENARRQALVAAGRRERRYVQALSSTRARARLSHRRRGVRRPANGTTVVLSGYSQRLDRASGHVNDEYLYSVRIGRCKSMNEPPSQ
jgi:hypothetical protein